MNPSNEETSFWPPFMVSISVIITQVGSCHVLHCYTCLMTCGHSSCCLLCSVVLNLIQTCLVVISCLPHCLQLHKSLWFFSPSHYPSFMCLELFLGMTILKWSLTNLGCFDHPPMHVVCFDQQTGAKTTVQILLVLLDWNSLTTFLLVLLDWNSLTTWWLFFRKFISL